MGKMYKGELARLPQTYKAAVELDSVSLISAVAAAATGPLVVIGSGGSLSVATYLCQLHERYTHNLAKAVTPLEFLEGGPRRDAAIWCISASGRNADIQAALECAVLREPKQVLAICMTAKSPLAALAQKYRFADVVEIELSSENDGFLATNSLLAMAIVGANAYRRFAAPNERLPPTYSDFLAMTLGQEGVERLSQRATSVLFGRETISLLYGNALKAAAVDLESRFVEAALGNLHAADFRNFAHGRHHWLAKRGASTGVIAFVGATVRELADRTFALLPPETPMLRWDFQGDDALQALAGLVVGLHVADDDREGCSAANRVRYGFGLSLTTAAYSRGMPGLPSCTTSLTERRFYDGFDAQLCRSEVETLKNELARWADRMAADVEFDAQTKADRAIERFNCYARGGRYCF